MERVKHSLPLPGHRQATSDPSRRNPIIVGLIVLRQKVFSWVTLPYKRQVKKLQTRSPRKRSLPDKQRAGVHTRNENQALLRLRKKKKLQKQKHLGNPYWLVNSTKRLTVHGHQETKMTEMITLKTTGYARRFWSGGSRLVKVSTTLILLKARRSDG